MSCPYCYVLGIRASTVKMKLEEGEQTTAGGLQYGDDDGNIH